MILLLLLLLLLIATTAAAPFAGSSCSFLLVYCVPHLVRQKNEESSTRNGVPLHFSSLHGQTYFRSEVPLVFFALPPQDGVHVTQ